MLIRVIASIFLLALVWAYWDWSHLRTDIYQFTLMVGGAFALGLAYWRSSTADSNLKQDQFRIGSELLDTRSPYVSRVAGAAILAQLVKEDPDNYHIIVMKAFEGFLEYPPRYGSGKERAGKIDFLSRDTLEVVRAINTRSKKLRELYCLELPCSEYAPFMINGNGDVEPNYVHKDFDAYIQEQWEKRI